MRFKINNNNQLIGYALIFAFMLANILTFRAYLLWLQWDKPNGYKWLDQSSSFYVNYMLWALLLPIVRWLAKSYPVGKMNGVREVLEFVVLVLILCACHEFTTYLIWFFFMDIFGIEEFGPSTWDYIFKVAPASTIGRVVEFCFLYLAFRAWNYYRQYQKQNVEIANIKTELSNAKLSALQAQLHPHFLFNTLNTISSLVDEDPKLGQDVISKLGNLLRTMLDHNDENLIPLQQEMDYVRSYLDIEQVRFSDRLTIRYEIAPDTYNTLVPQLILQPLVENAIKHGFAQSIHDGEILVKSQWIEELDRVRIIVRDDAKGASSGRDFFAKGGIGLRNVKERLFQVFGESASINIDCEEERFFEVEIHIPKKETNPI